MTVSVVLKSSSTPTTAYWLSTAYLARSRAPTVLKGLDSQIERQIEMRYYQIIAIMGRSLIN